MASVCAIGLFQMQQLVGGIWSVAAILIGGLLCSLLARIFARLSAVIPSGASLLAFMSRGLGKRIGIIAAGPYLMLMLFLVGIESLIVGHLVTEIVPAIPILFGTVLFMVLTWAVCRSGFQIGYRAQAASTWSLFACLVGLSIYMIFGSIGRGDLAANILPAVPSLVSFISAVGQALFLFMGFELVTSHAEVAEKGAVPSALKGSVIVLCLFYGIVSLGFSCLTDMGQNNTAFFIPQLAIAREAGGGLVTILVAFVCMLASFSSFNGALLALSRFTYALAHQGVMPRRLARMDPKTLTARASLNTLLGVALVFTLIVYLGELYRAPILAAAVSAALVYAAAAITWERPPFREADRRRGWVGHVLAGGLACLAVGVIVDAGPAMWRTILVLAIAYAIGILASLRIRDKKRPTLDKPVLGTVDVTET